MISSSAASAIVVVVRILLLIVGIETRSCHLKIMILKKTTVTFDIDAIVERWIVISNLTTNRRLIKNRVNFYIREFGFLLVCFLLILPRKHSIIFGSSPLSERIRSVVSPGVGLGKTFVSKLYFCRNSFIRSPLLP